MVGAGSTSTRTVLTPDAVFQSYYSTESAARIHLGRDVGIGGGAGVAFGGGGGALGSLSFIPISALIGSITLFGIVGGGGKLGNDSTFFN
jgi:hypothetical protein